MKAKNMKADMKVVIKDGAVGEARRYIGQVGVIERVWSGNHGADVLMDNLCFVRCYKSELRKSKEGEVK
jgi:hypothetical protein